MYKIFFLSFFLISCSGNNKDVDTNDSPPDNKNNQNIVSSCDSDTSNQWPYFWKIEKDGKTSYALGTIHITVSLSELPCANYIKSRLKNSDLLFSEFSSAWVHILKEKKPIETDSELNHLYTQNGFELMYDEDGSSFLQLSQSTQSFFREKGISTKLSHAGFTLASSALCFAEAYDHSIIQKSIEKELVKTSKSLNIPIKPLDTIELRSKVVSEFYTFVDVEEKVRNFSHCPDHVAQWSNQYKDGNMPVLEFSESFAKIALRDRNEAWLAKFISTQQNMNSIFITAGLAHFTGPYNLLEMLRNEGFTVSSGF